MDFSYSPKTQELLDKLIAFRDEHIYPNEEVFSRQVNEGDRWAAVPVVAELQARAADHSED